MKNNNLKKTKDKESRNIIIFGYSENDIKYKINEIKSSISSNINIKYKCEYGLSEIIISGSGQGIELLRFNLNKTHRILCDTFAEGLVSTDKKTISETLGNLMTETELTISTAESCTGGSIAHKIVETPGSSSYFLGSIVSYSNNVKSEVLKIEHNLIERNGAVSKEVVEAMANGVSKLLHTDCAIATSGIAGPSGGTKIKPVGTVWIAVKYKHYIYSERCHFEGTRKDIMQSASIYAIVMMIRIIKDKFAHIEESNDE